MGRHKPDLGRGLLRIHPVGLPPFWGGYPLSLIHILGAANGASFGAVLGILLGLPAFGIQLLAMILGIVAVLMAWGVGRVKGAMPPLMVILAGICLLYTSRCV